MYGKEVSVFQWIKMSCLALANKLFQPIVNLSIRNSLLLGFSAMAFVMLLATAIVFFSGNQLSKAMNVVLEQRLPTMMQTLQVANALDKLAATGTLLQSANSSSDLQNAELALLEKQSNVEQALENVDSAVVKIQVVHKLATELFYNLRQLNTIAKQRIALTQDRQLRRERLFSNLQALKQHLSYRVRIIEADNELINYLFSRPQPNTQRIASIAKSTAHWNSLQHFYRKIETISRRILAALQDPSPAKLAISRQTITTELQKADFIFKKLPAEIKTVIEKTFTEFHEIALSESGLLAFHQRELLLSIDSKALITENQAITLQVNEATSALVSQGIQATNLASLATENVREKYVLILLVSTGLGLLCIAALMYFHVVRHLLFRLSWLGESMLSIAAGKLDAPLPPKGYDELGHLGSAVHTFQQTAIDAERREAALLASNQEVERVYFDLKQQSQELALMNKKLEKLSITDALTGLANRRRFDESFATEWTRAERTQQPIALLMIDIDLFKNFNDRYGHKAGDECLQKVASSLATSACRAGDIVARYGGEEFSIISCGNNLHNAQVLAEKLRESVAAMSLLNEDTELGFVTISVGLAVCVPNREQTASDLFCLADKALYEAKMNGRNQVKSAPMRPFLLKAID